MIKIIVERGANKEITSLIVSGHANSGEYGHDLVCAGVSTAIMGGANALTNSKDYMVKQSDGNIEIKSLNRVSDHDKVVLETIYMQLKSIEESYPKNVKIVEKGLD